MIAAVSDSHIQIFLICVFHEYKSSKFYWFSLNSLQLCSSVAPFYGKRNEAWGSIDDFFS